MNRLKKETGVTDKLHVINILITSADAGHILREVAIVIISKWMTFMIRRCRRYKFLWSHFYSPEQRALFSAFIRPIS